MPMSKNKFKKRERDIHFVELLGLNETIKTMNVCEYIL